MQENTLKELGLNANETKAYLNLLQLGTAPASSIAKRLSLPRSTAKYTCQQLVEKGLATRINKNGAFLFIAKDPSALGEMLHREKQAISLKEAKLNNIMSDLKSMLNPQLSLPKVNFFEGPENVMKMLEDVLNDQKPIYGALNFDEDIHPDVANYLEKVYLPERKRVKQEAWMLFSDNKKTRDYQQHDKSMNRISLLVPEKEFPFDILFHIYGDKVAFYSYKKTDVMGVIIQNNYIRKMQFSLFKLAWNYARQLEANKQYANVEIDS